MTPRLGALTLLVALAAACGVPTQASFDEVRDSSFDVDPPHATNAANSTVESQAVVPVRPHFISESGVVPSPPVVESYEEILGALQTRPEDGSGLRTAVSTDTVLGIRNEGTAAVVDLAEQFQLLPPEEQRLAAAQIVLTLTDRVPTLRVRFALNDEPVDVPTADNTISLGGTVGRADYAALLGAP